MIRRPGRCRRGTHPGPAQAIPLRALPPCRQRLSDPRHEPDPEPERHERQPLVVPVHRLFVDQPQQCFVGVLVERVELADQVESYVGLEYDRRAIQAARKNAARRGRTNGQFLAGKVEELLPGVMTKLAPAATTILLDPPRTGCGGKTVGWLRQIGPAQVLYVSCHPATLARDLNVLCAGGVFELRRLVPLDMFPQTQHVECVADLRATAGAG